MQVYSIGNIVKTLIRLGFLPCSVKFVWHGNARYYGSMQKAHGEDPKGLPFRWDGDSLQRENRLCYRRPFRLVRLVPSSSLA